jgi:peptide/nickel transport system permease protein
MSLLGFITYRLVQSIPVLLGVAFFIFFMLRILPGDPALYIAGPEATAERVQEIRVQLGLDKPLHEQLLRFLFDLLQGNLGFSTRTGRPVVAEVLDRLPFTLALAVIAEAIAIVLGIVAGIVAAVRQGSIISNVVTVVSLFGVSMPVYWQGLMLILIFSVTLKLLPAGGTGTLAHFVMPSLVLAFLLMANIMRITKTSMLEVLNQNYVRTARAKGLRERLVLYRHALKNALIPVVTISGLQFGSLLGGAVLTETVFAWPGMGRLIVDAILARDYPLVQGAILIFALLFIVVNIAIDVLYAYIDPRVREVFWAVRQ